MRARRSPPCTAALVSKADLDDLRREAAAALRDVFAYAREGEPLSSGDHAYLDACQGKIAAFVAAAEQRIEALQAISRPSLVRNDYRVVKSAGGSTVVDVLCCECQARWHHSLPDRHLPTCLLYSLGAKGRSKGLGT